MDENLRRAWDSLDLARASLVPLSPHGESLVACLEAMLSYLEGQSQALSVIMGFPTLEAPSDALGGPTEAPIPLSQRLLGVLTAAERTSVAQCLSCRGRQDQFVSSLLTHVQHAHGTSLT